MVKAINIEKDRYLKLFLRQRGGAKVFYPSLSFMLKFSKMGKEGRFNEGPVAFGGNFTWELRRCFS